MKIDISVKDTEVFNRFVEIIGRYAEELPEAMLTELKGICEPKYDTEHFRKRGLLPMKVRANKVWIEHVVAIYPGSTQVEVTKLDEDGRHVIEGDALATERITVESLELFDTRGHAVCEELWWGCKYER